MTETPYNPVNDRRFVQLRDWIERCGLHIKHIEPASADASTRRYFRVFTDTQTLIAADSPPSTEKNAQFIDIAERLQTVGITTPRITQYDQQNGFILQQDFGRQHYLSTLQALQSAGSEQYIRRRYVMYADAVDAIVKMQRGARCSELPVYDSDFLAMELGLFVDWYLKRHLQISPDRQMTRNLKDVFDICISNALAQPQTFVHRDFHSRNLMTEAHPAPGVIDFQDAVYGPVTYDPVSLLRDCYIDFDDDFVSTFTNRHRKSLSPVPDADQYQRWFDLTGLQRHLKVLGIFSRLCHRDSKPQYLADIPRVLGYIRKVANQYPELSALRDIMDQAQENNS